MSTKFVGPKNFVFKILCLKLKDFGSNQFCIQKIFIKRVFNRFLSKTCFGQKIPDLTCLDLTCPDLTWPVQLNLTFPNLILSVSNWLDLSLLDLTSPDLTWTDYSWLVPARPVPTWAEVIWPHLTCPVLTWTVLTWPVLTWPVLTCPLDSSRHPTHYEDIP